MTDNEKRAHDLTMLFLKDRIDIIAEQKAEAREDTQNIHVGVNAMDVYCELYTKFLRDLSARFPES